MLTFSDDSNFLDKNSKEEGDKIDHDLEKYNTIDRIKEYLEDEIGKDVLEKAHPILKEFGDDILYQNNIPEVTKKLKGILSEDEVIKNLHFFATLVFFENEREKLSNEANRTKKSEASTKDDDKASGESNFTTFRIDQPILQDEFDFGFKKNAKNVFEDSPERVEDWDKTAKFGNIF